MSIEEEKQDFLRLLDERHNEQVYQSFLEEHTRFIPREFVQNHGVGQGLVLRKLPFGADYKSDFSFSPRAPMIGMLSLSRSRSHHRGSSRTMRTTSTPTL